MEGLRKAREVAKHLNLGVSTVYKMAGQGQIPAVRIGENIVRFDLNAVMEALKK